MSSRISDMVVTEYLLSHPMAALVHNTKTDRVHLFRNVISSAGAARCECGSAVFTENMHINYDPPQDLYGIHFSWCYSCVSNGMQILEASPKEAE